MNGNIVENRRDNIYIMIVSSYFHASYKQVTLLNRFISLKYNSKLFKKLEKRSNPAVSSLFRYMLEHAYVIKLICKLID